MSRFDYSKLAEVATALVTKFGAPAVVTLPGTADSAGATPWRGVDTDGTVTASIELAITDFEDHQIDGVRIRRTDKQGWTFPPTTGEDLRHARSVTQDGVLYAIKDPLVIKPASSVLAYRFTLRK